MAAAVAIGAAIYFATRESSDGKPKETATSTAPERAAERAPAPTLGPTPPLEPAGSATPPARLDEDPGRIPLEGLTPAQTEAYYAVEYAVRDCYRGRAIAPPPRVGGADETVQSLWVKYRAVVTKGSGRTADMQVAQSDIVNSTIQSCILDKARAASWSWSSDGDLGEITQEINLGNLLRPIGPPPPHLRSTDPNAPPPPAHLLEESTGSAAQK